MENETNKQLEEHLESVKEFNATTSAKRRSVSSKKSPPSPLVVWFGKNMAFAAVVMIAFFAIYKLVEDIKFSSPKYVGVVDGRITADCILPAPVHYALKRRQNKLCPIRLGPEEAAIVEIYYARNPRKGERVILKKYEQKTLFGTKFKYEFKRMG